MSTQQSEQGGTPDAAGKPAVEMKIEVHVNPVADVDRSLGFYQGLEWRFDADYKAGPEFRIVQLMPAGSERPVHFGRGVLSAAPGSANGYLVVHDLDEARAELTGHGVEVSGIRDNVYDTGAEVRVDGRDPDDRSYASYAYFSDPDGNG